MIGGLPTLLRLLESTQPGLRARAAEVLATCSQANPPVQVCAQHLCLIAAYVHTAVHDACQQYSCAPLSTCCCTGCAAAIGSATQ